MPDLAGRLHLSESLSEARLARGLTVEALALSSGVPERDIALFEDGRRGLGPDELLALAVASGAGSLRAMARELEPLGRERGGLLVSPERKPKKSRRLRPATPESRRAAERAKLVRTEAGLSIHAFCQRARVGHTEYGQFEGGRASLGEGQMRKVEGLLRRLRHAHT